MEPSSERLPDNELPTYQSLAEQEPSNSRLVMPMRPKEIHYDATLGSGVGVTG